MTRARRPVGTAPGGEAYSLASVASDFELTQVVDTIKGIHGLIPKAIFTG